MEVITAFFAKDVIGAFMNGDPIRLLVLVLAMMLAWREISHRRELERADAFVEYAREALNSVQKPSPYGKRRKQDQLLIEGVQKVRPKDPNRLAQLVALAMARRVKPPNNE